MQDYAIKSSLFRCGFHDFGNVNCVSSSAFSLDGDLAFPPSLAEVVVTLSDPLAFPGIPPLYPPDAEATSVP